MPVSPLGEFLSARRSMVRPRDVGLAEHGLRKVPGLRREEVAVVAAVSADYYTRLEGRERHPSTQILDALARALNLSPDEREHLFSLAEVVPQRSGTAPREDVSPELLRLMDGWPHTPAMVITQTLDVLARNTIAQALWADFDEPDNLVRMVFLDPVARRFYGDWDRAAQTTVANLRAASGANPNNPRLHELVTELETKSADFVNLWRQHEVRGKTHEAKDFVHSEVGELSLSFQAFDVRSAPGQELIVYQAEPASVSAERLALLGSLAVTGIQR